VREKWAKWHGLVPLPVVKSPEEKQFKPFISVIITTYNREQFLDEAINSMVAQTYKNFEVILVDDGSSSKIALEVIRSFEGLFESLNWKVVRIRNSYLGAARNAGVRASKGDYLLFMDDDNVAKPHELATFVKVMANTKVDILTCFIDSFTGAVIPDHTEYRWIPLGSVVNVGSYNNRFGDANFFIKREVFYEVGEFTTIRGVGFEDWEFLAKAVLKGFKLQVIPEPLFWKRELPGSMMKTTNEFDNYLRAITPYLEEVPHGIGLTLMVQRGIEQANSMNTKLTNSVEDYAVYQVQLMLRHLMTYSSNRDTRTGATGLEHCSFVKMEPFCGVRLNSLIY
jgi:glycosyltransferase involved in cell wall biosynthesis